MSLEKRAEIAEELLGGCGRMISPSKSTYRYAHPDNEVVFNANVCVRAGKIWHGDLDVTKSKDALLALSVRLGETVYVLREHDARFDNEEKPLLNKAVFVARYKWTYWELLKRLLPKKEVR